METQNLDKHIVKIVLPDIHPSGISRIDGEVTDLSDIMRRGCAADTRSAFL